MRKIEEWRDIRIALKGRAEYERNPGSFTTHEELWEEIKKANSNFKS